jgi:acyl-CoA thioester hydrolase
MMTKPIRNNYGYFESLNTRWGDNDIYGHVNNVLYYSYFDTVTNSFLIKHASLNIQSDDIVGFIVNSTCDYFSPIAYPESIDVGLRVNKLGNKSVEYGLAIFKGDSEEAAASGTFTHVFVSRASGKSSKIPEKIRSALERLK